LEILTTEYFVIHMQVFYYNVNSLFLKWDINFLVWRRKYIFKWVNSIVFTNIFGYGNNFNSDNCHSRNPRYCEESQSNTIDAHLNCSHGDITQSRSWLRTFTSKHFAEPSSKKKLC